MSDQVSGPAQGDGKAAPGPPSAPTDGPGAAPGECVDCIGAGGVLLALGFAMFAGYIAADFATGGRLTAALLGTLAALRGRSGEGGDGGKG